jgi:GT2 family glycosyltransferase
MIRSQLFHQFHGFDTSYFAYYEEADLCQRLRQAQYSCVILPYVRVQHFKSGGFRAYLNVRNMIWFEKKFTGWLQFIGFFCYFWLWFIPERIKKGSPLKELWYGSMDGWLGLNKGKARIL